MHDCIGTIHNRMVDPFNLQLEDLDINDIAHALALTNRFVGRTVEPYSVAQHSVMVSRLCRPPDALAGLLHDAAEAYLGDVATPTKQRPEMAGYRAAEERAMRVIVDKWGITGDWEAVMAIDHAFVECEAFRLFNSPPEWAANGYMWGVPLVPWSWQISERRFLERFYELTE